MGIRRGWPGEHTGSARRQARRRGRHGDPTGGDRGHREEEHQHERAHGHLGGSAGPTNREAVGRPAPPLPTGRAALGALLVVAAGVGTVTLAGRGEGGRRTEYVVASHDVDAGTVLASTDLRLAALRVPAAQAARLVRDPGRLVGAVTLGPVAAGELLQRGAVATAAAGPAGRELSVSVEPARAVGGRLRSGDRVDVLATFGAGADTRTERVASRVLVVRADDAASATTGRRALTLTLVVEDDALALRLAHAAVAADVTILRSTAVAP